MILLKAQAESVSTRKDRTIKISFSTQELKGKDAAKLLDLQNEMVSLGISPKGLTDEEIELLQGVKYGLKDVPDGKSRSKRLRNALYVYWQKAETGFEDSEAFYNDYMDRLTNGIIGNIP